MNDFLAVAIGVLLGVLASVPVAMVIAASTTPRPARLVRDRDAQDVVIEPASRGDLVECTTVQRGTVWLGPL